MKHVYIETPPNLGPACTILQENHCLINLLFQVFSQCIPGRTLKNSVSMVGWCARFVIILLQGDHENPYHLQENLPFSWLTNSSRAPGSPGFHMSPPSNLQNQSCCELPSSVVRNLAALPGHLGIWKRTAGTWKWWKYGKGDSYWKPSFYGGLCWFSGVYEEMTGAWLLSVPNHSSVVFTTQHLSCNFSIAVTAVNLLSSYKPTPLKLASQFERKLPYRVSILGRVRVNVQKNLLHQNTWCMVLQSSIKWQVLYLYPTSFQPSIYTSKLAACQVSVINRNTTTMVYPRKRSILNYFWGHCEEPTLHSQHLQTSKHEENKRLPPQKVQSKYLNPQPKKTGHFSIHLYKKAKVEKGSHQLKINRKNTHTHTPVSTKFPYVERKQHRLAMCQFIREVL